MDMIRTSRLDLVFVTAAIARADASNRAALPALLGARVPAEWPPALLADHLDEFAQKLESNPPAADWWGWYWILRDERAIDPARSGPVLFGSGGFMALDAETLIIGYSILDAFQRRGYATEAVAALLDWAFARPGVQRIVADTFPDLPASIRVLEKNGFTRAGSGSDPGSIRYQRTAPAP